MPSVAALRGRSPGPQAQRVALGGRKQQASATCCAERRSRFAGIALTRRVFAGHVEHVTIGAGFELVHTPWNPNDWVPPGSMMPLYDMFVAVTIEPLCTKLAFHALVTR